MLVRCSTGIAPLEIWGLIHRGTKEVNSLLKRSPAGLSVEVWDTGALDLRIRTNLVYSFVRGRSILIGSSSPESVSDPARASWWSDLRVHSRRRSQRNRPPPTLWRPSYFWVESNDTPAQATQNLFSGRLEGESQVRRIRLGQSAGESLDVSACGGTRHRSAVRFCQDHPTGAAAIVISHDGGLSVATKNASDLITELHQIF